MSSRELQRAKMGGSLENERLPLMLPQESPTKIESRYSTAKHRRTQPVVVLPKVRSDVIEFMMKFSNKTPQPPSPYQAKSYGSTSAESINYATGSSLLTSDESKYLKTYGLEQFRDL